ncbi:spore coat protein U domain-containing protein [Neisseria chenwenguii]|uniref:Spore coat protein SpoU n=1 Tax=Neisseria chenwenguii TaxID=1853278 RepID=A0A220RZM2_9NEIS|nr:spore coat protein U domain-containing protein [Neisseria chenwenguii]ASK26654.1 spore coat protein SpoU [Neisseria chenwenguii]ROV56316.1 spore coat protein SpoU [Neisseria chenwenguii]
MKKQFKIAAIAFGLFTAFAGAQAQAANGTKEDHFNVTIKLEGMCEVLQTNGGKTTGNIASEGEVAAMAGADIDFGTHDAKSADPALTQGNKGAAAGIQVHCSKNTPFNVGLTPLNVNSTTGQGTMNGLASGNSDTVIYQLYKPTVNGSGLTESIQNTASTNVWGDQIGTNTLALTGKGLNTPIQIPVWAKISGANSIDKYVDRYQDRVKVTLTY